MTCGLIGFEHRAGVGKRRCLVQTQHPRKATKGGKECEQTHLAFDGALNLHQIMMK